jgi:tetratricopeptide (TPR) repeat protein
MPEKSSTAYEGEVMGSVERSIAVADAILQLDPKSYLARSRRAWALYQLSRYPEAVVEYATVVHLYPGDIEMRLGLGYALAGSKRPVEAVIEFREVLKRMPANTRARVALGLP